MANKADSRHQGRHEAYASIAFGIIPLILALCLFVFGRPSVQPAIAIWVSVSLTVIITAPVFGAIGVYLSIRAKRAGCVRFLTNVGLICSILNILITSVPAFIYILFLFLYGF